MANKPFRTKHFGIKATSLTLCLMPIVCAASTPDWAKQNGIQLKGTTLYVVATGVGPSLDLARKIALDQATVTAADQLNGSANIQSMSIETEKTVSYHSEVSTKKTVEGLICKPVKEFIEEKENQFTVWIKCGYDTKLAKVRTADDSSRQDEKHKSVTDSQSIKIQIGSKETVVGAPAQGKITSGADRHIVLSVIPACVSILIRGKQSRTIFCKNNPVTILVLPADKEFIVRGPAGFAPKHLKVHEKTLDSESEEMEVYLDKM